MSLPLSLTLMFLAASLGVAAGYSIWRDLRHRDASRARRRMESEFQKPGSKPAMRTSLFKTDGQLDFDALRADRSPALDAPLPLPRRADWRAHLQMMVEQSGLKLSLNQLAYLCTGTTFIGASLGYFVGGPIPGGIGAIGLGLTPLLYVRHKQKSRLDRFVMQLPAAFDLMARVLRSGYSVPQAFQAVADSLEPPIAVEFAQCQEQQNLGMLPELTYRDLAQRNGILEVKIFVMAMMIQRQSGGNLSDVLERLAALVRERVRLRNHVRTLTAEGRMQALVLLVLPPVMFLVMRFVNRPYADILLEHTGLLAAMFVAMAAGALWIRKIIQFDF